MLFFLLILYFSLYYIRPSEWVPGLVGSRLLLVPGLVTVIFLFFGFISRKFPNMSEGQAEKMMFGYIAAIAMSHLSHLYFGGALHSLSGFIPTATGFFLVACYVDSKRRANILILILIALTTFLAYEGFLQYTTGFADGGVAPNYEPKVMPDGEIVKIARIRWYGVFNDPNDLGLALVLVIPFLLDMLLRGRMLLPLLTMPLIFAAMYFTNSRGTALAGVASIATYFVIRYRSFKGLLFGGLLGSMLLVFGTTRLASVSTDDESAYGRVEAWAAAFQMLRSSPVFGVGQGSFADINVLTAHNSFILVMAELGLFGLFFFTGMLYFSYYWLWNSYFKVKDLSLERDEIGFISAAFASLTGVLAAMFFLSRSYFLLPYILVGLIAAYTRVIESGRPETNADPEVKPKHFRNIFIFTLLQIVGLNIVVKVLL